MIALFLFLLSKTATGTMVAPNTCVSSRGDCANSLSNAGSYSWMTASGTCGTADMSWSLTNSAQISGIELVTSSVLGTAGSNTCLRLNVYVGTTKVTMSSGSIDNVAQTVLTTGGWQFNNFSPQGKTSVLRWAAMSGTTVKISFSNCNGGCYTHWPIQTVRFFTGSLPSSSTGTPTVCQVENSLGYCAPGTDVPTMAECQAMTGTGVGTWLGDLSGSAAHVAVHPRGCWVYAGSNRHWIQPDGVLKSEANSKPICCTAASPDTILLTVDSMFTDAACTTKSDQEARAVLEMKVGQCTHTGMHGDNPYWIVTCSNGKITEKHYSDSQCTTEVSSLVFDNGGCSGWQGNYMKTTWPRGLCEVSTNTVQWISITGNIYFVNNQCALDPNKDGHYEVSQPSGACKSSLHLHGQYSKLSCNNGKVEELFYMDSACATLSTKVSTNPVSFQNGVCNNQLGFPLLVKWDANIGCGTTMAATTTAKQVSAGQLSALNSSIPISNISQTIYHVFALLGLVAALRYVWSQYQNKSGYFKAVPEQRPEEI